MYDLNNHHDNREEDPEPDENGKPASSRRDFSRQSMCTRAGVEFEERIAHVLSVSAPIFHFELPHGAQRNREICMNGAVTGLGMFSESYFLFAIGNLTYIWQALYPSCFEETLDDPPCSNALVESLAFIEVGLIIVGMLSFGYLADQFGRRWGSCTTAIIMSVGGVLTTVAYAGPNNYNGLFTFFACALAIFSYGVGGEYPLASTTAAERAETAEKLGNVHAKHIRGKTVVMTFAMQGWGNWTNTLVLIILMAAMGCTGDYCSPENLNVAWRVQYGLGALFVICLAIYRVVCLEESSVWQSNRQKSMELRGAEATMQQKHHHLFLRHFWPRLIGTTLGWFVWDIVFYGNKLFQGTIIAAIIGKDPTIIEVLYYTLLNSTIALVGYYCAAFCIDKPWMGRRNLQAIGFFFTFVLFLVCGVGFEPLRANPGTFQALYYLSTFFGQFGPNSTTWLYPSEVVPTKLRSRSHGFAAAAGKCGALVASLVFPHLNHVGSIFYICSAMGLVGLVVTIIFLPDVTELELSELDDWWWAIRHNEEYEGKAQDPYFLSSYERHFGTSIPCIFPRDIKKPEEEQDQGENGNQPVGALSEAAAASTDDTSSNLQQQKNLNTSNSSIGTQTLEEKTPPTQASVGFV